jgi:peptidoglycan/LPS O-acetylase OafA/YrhL
LDHRIKPLDGLRTLAAFGIVWIHSWIFTGNPSLKTFNIDMYRVIAIAGNGVSFFFVISGFFMYLVLSKKNFSVSNYLEFIANRWKRIAPAYYVSAIAYSIYFLFQEDHYPFFKLLLIDFVFLNNLFYNANIISPYWSLGTEWHFYLLLPLLFIFNDDKKIFVALCFFALLSLLFLFSMHKGILNEVFWRAQILPRFIEFAWGILAGFLYKNKIVLPWWMRSVKAVFFSIVVTYAGRLLMVTEIIDKFGSYGWLARSFGEPVMTFGFAWFLYLMVTEKSRLSDLLSKPFFSYLGKLSYSVYLWHAVTFLVLEQIKFIGTSIPWLNSLLVFFLTSGLTILIAHFSYKYLEAPYFRSKKI